MPVTPRFVVYFGERRQQLLMLVTDVTSGVQFAYGIGSRCITGDPPSLSGSIVGFKQRVEFWN